MAYNGWSNYETWNVALWIGNDQGSQSQSEQMAQEAWDSAEADRTFTREQRAVLDLAEQIKEWVENENPLANDASMFSDLLLAALGEVDWREIAENWLEDVDKEADEDEDEDEDADEEEVTVSTEDTI